MATRPTPTPTPTPAADPAPTPIAAPPSADPAPTRVSCVCPACRSEVVIANGIAEGGTPSDEYTELRRRADENAILQGRIATLMQRVAELESGLPPVDDDPDDPNNPPNRSERGYFI